MADVTRASDLELLRRIDAYLDFVPRTAARAETIGPFTLFVSGGVGWNYYARPTQGSGRVRPRDVAAVRKRQRELAIPETFEWIVELIPDVGAAAAIGGLRVLNHPLMTLEEFQPSAGPTGVELRTVGASDDLAMVQAVAAVAFAHPGTSGGGAGSDAVKEAAGRTPPERVQFVVDRLAGGRTVTVAAFDHGKPVAVGSHQPVGDITEIVGLGTLPTHRRRGLGAAVTSVLVQDARERGVRTIFLSAGDEEISRVYERLGFRHVGTAGAAEPPERRA